MKRYIPHIIISFLIFIVFMQCKQLKNQGSELQAINDDLIRSRTRESILNDKLAELQDQEKEITRDTLKTNKKHVEIRNNLITDAIFDSLVRSVYTRGQKRFDQNGN